MAVARDMVYNSQLNISYEPTGNLDLSNGDYVMQLLTDRNEKRTMVVMITNSEHDPRYSQRIIGLPDGQEKIENIML